MSIHSHTTEKGSHLEKSLRLFKDDSKKDVPTINTETKIASKTTPADSNNRKTKKNYAMKRFKVKK
jgi:hypothetical protein